MNAAIERTSQLRTAAIAVAHALTDARLRLVTVESCTGGLVAAAITAQPGSSAWFDRGYVTYSDESKCELGVEAEVLASHGAVSEEVAAQMALGGLRSCGLNTGAPTNALTDAPTDIVALAITGIAGPTGGSSDKPCGTVCFAWAGLGGLTTVTTATRQLRGHRDQVRFQAAHHALHQMAQLLAAPSP